MTALQAGISLANTLVWSYCQILYPGLLLATWTLLNTPSSSYSQTLSPALLLSTDARIAHPVNSEASQVLYIVQPRGVYLQLQVPQGDCWLAGSRLGGTHTPNGGDKASSGVCQ